MHPDSNRRSYKKESVGVTSSIPLEALVKPEV